MPRDIQSVTSTPSSIIADHMPGDHVRLERAGTGWQIAMDHGGTVSSMVVGYFPRGRMKRQQASLLSTLAITKQAESRAARTDL